MAKHQDQEIEGECNSNTGNWPSETSQIIVIGWDEPFLLTLAASRYSEKTYGSNCEARVRKIFK